MKDISAYFLVSLLIATVSVSNAQTYDQLDPKLQELVTENSTSNWLYFQEGLSLDPSMLFVEFRSAFGLSSKDEMRIVDSFRDSRGISHYYFSQFHSGMRVDQAFFSVHVNALGNLYCAHGKIVNVDAVLNSVSISQDVIIDLAMEHMDIELPAWESERHEAQLKIDTQNPDTSYFPKPEIIIVDNENAAGHIIAYELTVVGARPFVAQQLLMDATSGEILEETDGILNCNQTQVATLFDGVETIHTKQYLLTGEYRLEDDCQDAKIRVRKNNLQSGPISLPPNPLSPDITSSDNNWFSDDQRFGASALWAAKHAHNYFFNVHQINSYNDNGGNLALFTNGSWEGGTVNQATTSNILNWIWFGEGSDPGLQDAYVTLDIVAHEYGHLVNDKIGHITQLEGVVRTFHESFADIFGECVEGYVNELNNINYGMPDWFLGEQRDPNGYSARSFADPNSRAYHVNSSCANPTLGQPDTYEGTYWDDQGCDPYINTGVQNHFFYLLTQGGNGENDLGYHFSFNGVGLHKARQIAFATLAHTDDYITYENIKNYWVAGAVDAFGAGSIEVQTVKDAWCAVGVDALLYACNSPVISENNNCESAQILNSQTSCSFTSGDSNGASSDGFSPCAGTADDDVWYRFTALSTEHTITVDGYVDFAPMIDLWVGGCNGGSIGCSTPAGEGGTATYQSTSLSIGTEYLVRIYDYLPGGGDFDICITHPTDACVAQNNNSCYTPYNLNIASTCSFQSGDLCGATQSVNPSNCSGTQPPESKDVWYTITPNANQTNATIICQSGTSTDIVLGLYSGVCPNFNLVQCVNNSGLGGTETINATLSSGTTYFIRVYDHNGNANGTDYQICVSGTGNEGGGCAAPTTQSSSITFPYVGDQQLVIQWEVGNGNRRVVMVNDNNSFSPPTNGTDPTGDNSWNNAGQQVVYNGSGDVVTLTGLQEGTTYWVRVYEANCTGGASEYYTVSATGNPASATTISGGGCSAPTTQAANLFSAYVETDQMEVHWNNGNGDWRLVKISQSNSFSAPVDGVIENANNVYQNQPNEQVVYVGTGNSVLTLGLSPGQTYWFHVYEANCYDASTAYNTSSANDNPLSFSTEPACSTPTIQASNIYFSNVGIDEMTVNWTNGNGTRRVVIANTTNSFTDPINGSDPTGNPVYSGSGEQVVYNGTGSSLTVTGLSSNTWYWYHIYEAKCSGGDSYYNTFSEFHESFDHQLTETECLPPPAPTINIGEVNCPGTNYGYNSSVSINWSSTSATWYDYVIEEYPFGSLNEVYSEVCHYGVSTTPSYSFERGKLYRVKVRGTTNCQDCYGDWSDAKYFHFMPELTPYGNGYVDCSGSGMTLTTPEVTVPSPGSVSYVWYDGFGNQIGSNSNTYFAANSGSYHVTLEYSGSSECLGTATTGQSFNSNITVTTYPDPPVLSGNTTLCEGNQLTLNASAQSSSLYFWSGPNGFTSNNPTINFPSATSDNAGTYTCYVIKDGCQSLDASIEVIVNPAPGASFSYIVNGYDVSFTNQSANADSYSWDFGDGQVSSLTDPANTYGVDGTYAVCLTSSSTGCTDNSNCQIVQVGNTIEAADSIFARIYHPDADTAMHFLRDLIQSEADSGFIIVGDVSQQVDPYNQWAHFMKLDKNGDVLWSRELSGSGNSWGLRSIVKSNNGYLMNGFLPGGSGVSTVAKIDENGNMLWSKDYTDPNGLRLFDKMVKTPTGYILTGRTSGQSLGALKIDDNGAVLWQKDYSFSQISAQQQYIGFTIETSDGGILLGAYNIEAYQPPYPYNSVLLKIASDGSLQWSKLIDSGHIDQVFSAYEESNGNFVVGGISQDGSSNYESTLYRISSTGTMIEAKTIGSEYGSVRTVMRDQTEFVVTTRANYLIKIDDSFDVIHGKVMRDLESLEKSIYTLDNEIVSAQRFLTSTTPVYIYDYAVTKTNSDLDRICLDSTVTVNIANLSATSTSFTSAVTNTNVTAANSVVSTYTAASADSNMCSSCTVLTPLIEVIGELQICPGESVQLAVEEGMGSYLWNTGSVNDTIAIYSGGIYSVDVIDSNGCPGSSNEVQVSTLSLPFANAGTNEIICVEDSVLIGTPEIAGNIYQWIPTSGVGDSNSATPMVSPGIQTEYEVTVTAANGCEAVDTVIVSVNTLPQIFPGNNQTISYGQPVTLGGNPSASGTGPFNYNWSPSNSGLNGYSLSNPTATPLTTTTYTLHVSDGNGCSNSNDVTITVLGGCDYTISTDENLPLMGEGGSGISTITATGNNCSIWTLSESCSWLELDTLQGENTTNVVFSFEPNLTGQIRSCTIQLQNGQEITVNQDFTTGLMNDSGFPQMNLYPNPNSGQFNLVLSGISKGIRFEVFDKVGQLVKTSDVLTERSSINMKTYAEGVYMLRLMRGDELLGVQRVMLIK